MNKETKPAQVFHFDLQGKREFKYDFLSENSLSTISWNELKPEAPNFFLVKKNFDQSGLYEKGFKVDELFNFYKMGSATGKDETFVSSNTENLKSQLTNYKIDFLEHEIITYNYRVFDERKFLYNNQLIQRLRVDLQKHFFKENIALVTTKILSSKSFFHLFISKKISDRCLISNKGQEGNYFFPLYLYPEATAQQTIGQSTDRTPNLNTKIVKQIAEKLNLEFVNEKINNSSLTINNYFAPIDILDYIYAVLHSPTYREQYKEFLKIDFPRVPYPKDLPSFQNLVSLGGQLRQIHLLESPTVEKYITQYPEDGNNVVVKPRFSPSPSGRAGVGLVYINDTQYFDNVPEVAWNFYIGGYQPAQKWLKDRKDRKLEFDDILHYQKIIVALTETNRLMKEIDKIEIK
ncbi:MAG: hypothetical protein EAZ53_14840 [Bacteroidetes bacterium]|nr:MAG: hypothetical protein EAZ53_14840 [Bacteroidota bacterium]